ncbi:Sphingolipid C4-hydroxylase sur2 [Vanrija albida]|uniref:Sphingolipid C4-hydroxylase sur2 n=1 Tax=Vanrija albida TaxID=181172 RepID=A0ABR3PWI7_9TREE
MLPFPTAILDYLPSFNEARNSTLLAAMAPAAANPPFYHTTRPHIFDFISDRYLALAAPVLVYWVLSTVFHALDTLELPYFEARRIHDSAETKAKNRAGFWQVIRAVLFQQFIQTLVGLLWVDSDDEILAHQVNVDHVAAMRFITPRVADLVLLLVGPKYGVKLLESRGHEIVNWVYWWGIPIVQMFAGFCIIDTWQYFLHRAMHTYPTLYRQFHSHHHRLYVPFAFGALYNHPVEGFLLDTLGAAIAELLTFMTVRQAILLFTLSTWKTVDDHCGYKLWWDPCQLFFANNADYHDIHHQSYGIKANFAQPFFTNWDYLLGTQMTRAQADARRSRPAKDE